MSEKENVVFKYTINGEETELCVRPPSFADVREARKVYNNAFNDAIRSGALLRIKLNAVLEKQGVWNAEKESRYTTLNTELVEGIKTLEKGDKKMALSQARTLALKVADIREQIRELISERGQLDNVTAEGQADNARFQYLVSVCLVYNTSKKAYYKNYEDFVQRSEEPLAYIASQHLMNLQYGFQEDNAEALPEWKFLKKFKFVDEKLRLVNKDGHLVDVDGRLINEEGRFIKYVDDKVQFVDRDGDPVNEEGNPLTEFQGFLDDETGEVVGLEPEKPVQVFENEQIVTEEDEVRVLVTNESVISKKKAKGGIEALEAINKSEVVDEVSG